MRREYSISREHHEKLPEGLVFWAKLDYGNLSDTISGVEGSPCFESGIQPSDNLSWDSNNNAYKFRTNARYQNSIRFYLPNFSSLVASIQSNSIIWSCEVKCSSNTCYYPITFGYCKNNDSGHLYGYTPSHLNRVKNYVFDGRWHKVTFGFEFSTHTIYHYVDGVLRATSTDYYSSSQVWKPNWNAEMKKYISLGVNQDGQGNITYWIRDMKLFNKEFTQQELSQL